MMSTDKRRFALRELLKIIQILERMAKNKETTISALVEEMLHKLDEDTILSESQSAERLDARVRATFQKLREMPQACGYFTTSQVADSLKISPRSAGRYMNHLAQMGLLTVTKVNRKNQYRMKDVSQQSVGDPTVDKVTFPDFGPRLRSRKKPKSTRR
jgi:Fic family protein